MATILIVDDLSANRSHLAALLRPEGHRLLEASNGSEGLAKARAEHPDLVITDLLMPVMDGYEFARQLRLDPATRAIPVVFATAQYGEKEARALASMSGVSYVLRRPAGGDETVSIVRRALSGGEAAVLPAPPATGDREQLRLLTCQLSEKAGDLRVANARLRALINVGLELASERDPERLLHSVSAAVCDLFGATYVTLGIIDLEARTLERVVTAGTPAVDWFKPGDSLPGILQTVVTERCTLRGDSASVHAAGQTLPMFHPDVQAYLAAPVSSPTQVYGWICLVGNEGRSFTEEDEDLVAALSGQIGRIYENSHLYEVAQRRTEQLEHEILERTQAEDALRTSEGLTRDLVEHLPHRILVKDRNSVVQFCNQKYAGDFGLTPAEVIGKDAFALYPPSLAEAYLKSDLEVMADGLTLNLEQAHQVDGEERWIHTVKVPYHSARGDVTGVLVVFDDITDRKRLEDQLRQSQKLEAIGRLASGVAHDFNNLLTSILGYCELLMADFAPDDARQNDIMEIQKAGLSAARLTGQLLAFSRKQIIEPTLLDLNAVVANMQAMLVRLIGEDVRVVLALAPEVAMVRADQGQLDQILLNLVVNARDAMPHGGILTIETAHVELDDDYPRTHLAAKSGPHVALTVTDTGTGITPAVQARLFEPFFTTKPVGKGTGLGLATIHGIVTRAGGSVNVYSEVGRGTSFKVYFPRPDAAELVVDPPLPVAPVRSSGETVLLVEDADQLRVLTRRLLERLGYTVLVAANATEAVQLFELHPSVSIILTDVVMPGASGPELTRQLVEQRPGLQVVYMSGYTEESIVQHGLIQQGIAFLHKPFTSEALGRKLREVLARRALA